MKRINALFAVIGLVFMLFLIGIGFAIGVANPRTTVQAQAPVPTTIDTPMTFERPALQAESLPSAVATTIDVPAVYPSHGDNLLRAQDVTDIEARVIALFNIERQRNGKPPVVKNSYLTLAAQRFAQFLATCGCKMGHEADGSSPWQRIPAAGYTGSLGGEILAGGQTTPEQVVGDWIKSSGHHDIMIGAYGEVGVALVVQQGSQYTYNWVADWGGSPGQTTPGGNSNPGPQPQATPTNPYQPGPGPLPPAPTFTFPWWLFTPSPQQPTPFVTATPFYRPPATVTPQPQQPTPIPQPVGNGWRIVTDCAANMQQCSTTVYPR